MKCLQKVQLRSALGVICLLVASLLTLGCGPETYHGRFLASWSPDGSRAAAVPNLMEDKIQNSGIWVFDSASGQSTQILALNDGRFCFHPQWSPFNNEILFGMIRKDDDEETKDPTDHRIPYSVWVIGADGQGLRKVTDSTSLEVSHHSGMPAFLLPNTIAWGPLPGTVIFQTAAGEKIKALLLDPYTGHLAEFLPHAADAYSLEPSPSREKAAAVLYDEDAGTAEVLMSDFGVGNWRRLATIGFDSDQLGVLSPMIYWSPDSSCFVVPEEERGFGLKGKPHYYLRLFDARTGRSWKTAFGNPNTAIIWDSAGRNIFFSGPPMADDDSDSVIYRTDRRSGCTIPVVPEGDNFLISLNHENERIYFYRKLCVKCPDGSEKVTVRRLLSCASDGTDVRELGPWIENDGLIWSRSPDGRMLVFPENLPQLVDLLYFERQSS